MQFFITTALSALIIATATELGKRSAFMAALLISLPLSSILALTFLYWGTGDAEKVASLSMGIFWLVLPTLAFFLVLPVMLRHGWSFWLALPAASLAMAALFAGYSWALAKLGIQL